MSEQDREKEMPSTPEEGANSQENTPTEENVKESVEETQEGSSSSVEEKDGNKEEGTSDEPKEKKKKKAKSLPILILHGLSSYGLTSLLLLLFIVVVVVGTLAQKNLGLHQAKKVYFESYYFSLPLVTLSDTAEAEMILSVPFPGGMTLMGLMFINLMLSFFIKFQWKRKKVGLWISHMGLFVLFVGSFITYTFSEEGMIALTKGKQANSYRDYHENEFVIQISQGKELGPLVAFHEKELRKKGELKAKGLPFTLKIKEYMDNARHVKIKDPAKGNQEVFKLQELKTLSEFSNNKAGIVIQLIYDGQVMGEADVIRDRMVQFSLGENQCSMLLRRQVYPLPFTVRLIHTLSKQHPGTMMAQHYESKVEVIDGKTRREALITMNSPLRYRGYTFYQSGFDDNSGNPQTVLEVVNNPTVSIPYISSLLVLLGLVIHFMQKLMRFLRQRNRGLSQAKPSSETTGEGAPL